MSMTMTEDRWKTDAGYQLSLRLHNELEALYTRIEQHAALFRGLLPVDKRLPRPPGKPPGVRLDPLVCALSMKAATTKRAVFALCELGDGDNAIALARVLLENACLLEWLIRGDGRLRLEAYAMFLSVGHERAVAMINRQRARLIASGADVAPSSDDYHRAVWDHTFKEKNGPTKSDRPTWSFDLSSGKGEPVRIKAMFEEIAQAGSFEYEVLYGAFGSEIVHSGPFGLGRTLRSLGERFVLRVATSSELCTIALSVSNAAMYLVLDSLTQYIGLDLTAELAPMKASAAANPYALVQQP